MNGKVPTLTRANSRGLYKPYNRVSISCVCPEVEELKSGWSGWREKEVVSRGREEEKRKRTLGKRERAVVLRAESMTSIMERILGEMDGGRWN